jgi:hypothetical protein
LHVLDTGQRSRCFDDSHRGETPIFFPYSE